MKTSYIVIIIFSVVFIGICMNTPSEYEVVNSKEAPTVNYDGSVDKIKYWLKQNLKDPDSYEAIEWSDLRKEGDSYYITHKYRSKNSFGGYTIELRLFTINANGSVTASEDMAN